MLCRCSIRPNNCKTAVTDPRPRPPVAGPPAVAATRRTATGAGVTRPGSARRRGSKSRSCIAHGSETSHVVVFGRCMSFPPLKNAFDLGPAQLAPRVQFASQAQDFPFVLPDELVGAPQRDAERVAGVLA